MRRLAVGAALLLLVGQALADKPTPPKRSDYPNAETPEASVYRGSIVFSHYCITCHGAKGDGAGRAAKLYTPRPSNLQLSDKNIQYKELIVRQGGKAIGRSEFMPAWNEELTKEQITDVVNYLETIVVRKK